MSPSGMMVSAISMVCVAKGRRLSHICCARDLGAWRERTRRIREVMRVRAGVGMLCVLVVIVCLFLGRGMLR